jgi:hypothetical protein
LAFGPSPSTPWPRSRRALTTVAQARMAATMLSNLNALARSTSVRDIKDLNLIPPLAFVKKEPRMLDDYRIFRWWQGK